MDFMHQLPISGFEGMPYNTYSFGLQKIIEDKHRVKISLINYVASVIFN
jgi:hypothetical protein